MHKDAVDSECVFLELNVKERTLWLKPAISAK